MFCVKLLIFGRKIYHGAVKRKKEFSPRADRCLTVFAGIWKIVSKDIDETLLIKYREYYKEGTKVELKKKLNALRSNLSHSSK